MMETCCMIYFEASSIPFICKNNFAQKLETNGCVNVNDNFEIFDDE